MNLFQVWFIQGKIGEVDYGQTVHQLIDTDAERKIITLALSGDKLASAASNWIREPKRLTFECFPDSWITTNLLSGPKEHERNISWYEVQVYRDGNIVFSGIIDTSALKWDPAAAYLTITCYDKLKLFNTFSDLTQYYSLSAGYTPLQILQYFIQNITARIPILMPYSGTGWEAPDWNIDSGTPLEILTVDYNEMLLFPEGETWTYALYDDAWGPKYGLIVDLVDNKVTFVFGHKVSVSASAEGAGSQYQGRFKGRVITFHNNMCPDIKEYDQKTSWVSSEPDPAAFETEYDEFIKFFADNGISEDDLDALDSTVVNGDAYYGTSQWAGHWVKAQYHGPILPAYLKPGKSYETYQTEQTDCIRVLQAMLMMYNSTLICDADGVITLLSKIYDPEAEAIEIADNDVASISVSRADPENPDTTIMSVMAGESALLQSCLKPLIIAWHNQRWTAEAVISGVDVYSIALHSIITIDEDDYAVISVTNNYAMDQIEVNAWML